jgi:peroxiredoxin
MRYFRVIAALTLSVLFAAEAAELPRPAPDLAINFGPGTKQVRLSDYRGKTVVLAFILTYCSHCQAVIRGLIKDYQEFGPKGVQVIASAIEDAAATALPGFRRQFAPPFPVGYNSHEEAIQFLQHPPALGFYMPALVFIDKDGQIRAQYEGRDTLLNEATQEKSVRDEIIKIMNRPSAPDPAKPVTSKNKKKIAKKN